MLRKCLNRNRNDLEIFAKKLLQVHVCSRRSLRNGTSSRKATVLVYYSDDLVFKQNEEFKSSGEIVIVSNFVPTFFLCSS